VTRSSKLPGAKNEELIVEASDESPQQGAAQRPDNEESLEVKVEQHTGSCYINVAQVGFDWPGMALLSLLARHENLGTGTPSLSFQHCLLVDSLSATEVNDPNDNHDQAYRKDEAYRNDWCPLLEVALLVIMVQSETRRANFACV